jgi:hypothetical protein
MRPSGNDAAALVDTDRGNEAAARDPATNLRRFFEVGFEPVRVAWLF